MCFMYILYIREFVQLKWYFIYFLSEYNVRKVRDDEHDYMTKSENSSHRSIFHITKN